ncbi:tetratricopeptide repeat protein [Solilutibacter pythonis]|nr:tetratricopeptide repeat protein [Lysobacter pythonis]
MSAFLAAAGLLLLLTLFAVLRPLARRQRPLAGATALAVILASGALYWHFGTPAALDPAMLKPPTTLAENRAQLETLAKMQPDNAEVWRRLGYVYATEKRMRLAADAFTRAARLMPEDADILTEAAKARSMARDDRAFDAEAMVMLETALKNAPDHASARLFLGIAQHQAGQAAKAAETWMPLLSRINAKTGEILLAQINQARTEAGLAPMTMPTQAAETAGLRVEVAFDSTFIRDAKLQPSARIFVIARAAGGPPMPVAVQKLEADALPASIVLTDADSPMPTLKLSALKEVEVLARLSMSGQANRQDGDIESAAAKVKLPSRQPVKLTLGGN